jgi:hypothetical protein
MIARCGPLRANPSGVMANLPLWTIALRMLRVKRKSV